MATTYRKFDVGILLKASSTATATAGQMRYDSSANAIKCYLDSAERTFATLDQTQTFTNKNLTSPTITGSSLLGVHTIGFDGVNNQYLNFNSTDNYVGRNISTGDVWLNAQSGQTVKLGVNGIAIASASVTSLSVIRLDIGSPTTSEKINLHTASGPIASHYDSDALANGNISGALFTGAKSGGSNATTAIGTIYNSSSTSDQACSYLQLTAGNGTIYFLWVDDTGDLQISTSGSAIGTAAGTVVGTQS